MRIAAILFVAVALCVSAFAQERLPPPADAKTIEGIWFVSGTESGTPYTGACVIKNIGEDTYVIDYVVQGTHAKGHGLMKGKTISFAWRSLKEPFPMGVSQFEVSADGKALVGHWIATGNDKPREERMQFLRKLEPDPEV